MTAAAALVRAAIASLVAPIVAGPAGLLVAAGGNIGGSVGGTQVPLLTAVAFYGYLAALVPLAITGASMLALASHYPALWARRYWALAGSLAGLVLAFALDDYLPLLPTIAGGAASALLYRLIVGRPGRSPGGVEAQSRH